MSDYIPIADKGKAEYKALKGLIKQQPVLAAIVILVAVAPAIGGVFVGFILHGKNEQLKEQVASLEKKCDKGETALREAERETRGLRETVAPLLTRAAKEFPGEEINVSLKRLLERFEGIEDRLRNVSKQRPITKEGALRISQTLTNVQGWTYVQMIYATDEKAFALSDVLHGVLTRNGARSLGRDTPTLMGMPTPSGLTITLRKEPSSEVARGLEQIFREMGQKERIIVWTNVTTAIYEGARRLNVPIDMMIEIGPAAAE